VTAVPVERFLPDLAVRRSVRTAARVRTTLRGLFDYAVRTRRLRVSPALSVRLPRPDSRSGKVVEVHPFSLDVLLSVVEVQRGLAGKYADITLVLALTGVRFGELRGLRVRDVTSVPYPGVLVQRSIPQSGLTGAVIERATTKSGRSRMVPLSDRVRPVVESWASGPGAGRAAVPRARGRLHPRAELAPLGALVDHRPRTPTARPAAHRRQPVDRGRGGH
jgi:integrase